MSKRALPWTCLALLLVLFLCYLAWLRPENSFGMYHDDTVYFSSAQALAQGRGYVLPSIPGPEGTGGAPPRQTKYPVLYPWLLSWIWRWWSSFPANVTAAVWLTAAFSCCFLVAAFCLLRQLRGLGDWPALACVGLCAFHPFFLTLSGAVLSDIPFMTFALAAAVLADRALAERDRVLLAAAAGMLAGLSTVTRSIGVAVVVGVVAAALYRRAWRQAAVTLLVAAPFVVAVVMTGAAAPQLKGEPGWRQTWLYYTSYWAFWKLSVPDFGVFWAMVSSNLKDFLVTPAAICLFPPPGGEGSYAGLLLCVTLTAGIFAGIARRAGGAGGDREWKPIHFVFLFYSPLTLLWNYAIMNRFLMLFLPLFYAGIWIEGRHLVLMVRENLRRRHPPSERVLAGGLGLAVAVLGMGAVWHYVAGNRPALRERTQQWAGLLLEQQEAYDWIRRHTNPDDRLIAIDDVKLYLNTGRQAMWPIAFSTALVYRADPRDLDFQLDHITDVARHIGARYWLAADYDYDRTAPQVIERLSQLKSVLPRVFQSRKKRIEIYDLSCVLQPVGPECREAPPTLFSLR